MITIQKEKDSYGIYAHTGKIGWATLYENPWHAANSYLKIELQNWDTLISETLCAVSRTVYVFGVRSHLF